MENLAQELVEAAHSVAGDEGVWRGSNIEVYLPMIVTTARLKTCLFNPRAVNLDLGTIPSAEWEDQDVVRFRKTLTLGRSNDYDENLVSLYDWQLDRMRTVMVVRASALVSLLSQFATEGGAPAAYTNPPL